METIYYSTERWKDSVERRTRLFDMYIRPHLNLVYSLCIRYSHSKMEIQDNYIEVLVNFYRYIESYDPTRSLQTWIHIVAKRYIADLNERNGVPRLTDDIYRPDLEELLIDENRVSGNCMGLDNYRELYSDDLLWALSELKPIYREALLLQQAGYKLSEIMEITYRRGSLKTRNIETVKSRIFLAKQQMKGLITRDGERRAD